MYLETALDRELGSILYEDTPSEDISNEQSERRICKRCTPGDKAFAVFRPEFNKIGKINDISSCGVSFSYINTREQKSGYSFANYLMDPEIDILISDEDIHLKKIPCRVVYDNKIFSIETDSIRNMEVRQCGLEFMGLTIDQLVALNSFIDRF